MPSRAEVIESLAPKYVWWTLEGSEEALNRRILAQIMDLGTYDDILAIEAVFDRDELVKVMMLSEPGWFSPRSWNFWRGRLSLSGDEDIPESPPRRSFGAETLRARV
jgi:hypothetical protein